MIDISKVGTRLGDLDSIPEELKKQIKETTPFSMKKQISVVLEYDLEKTATINEILVCIYRRYKTVLNKRSLYSTLEQMRRDGVLKSIDRGIYTLKESK